ncbi:MAG: hypothetical protein JXB23_08290 [Candidatus Aminicenantes bacterium]|nr:hypothetical protein [Candidatus Aminicenantes bacterium]
MSKNRHLIPILISVLIGILSVIYYLIYYKYLLVDVDEGLLLNGALRVLDGQLPLKDFHQYTMGRFYLLALWFLAFGKSIAVERLLFVFLHTMKNILAFHVSKRIMPLPFSLIPSLLLLVIPGFWTKAFVNSILLLNIFFLLNYLAKPKKWNLIILGLSIGFSVYFREDLAGYSFITAGIILFLYGIAEQERIAAILEKGMIFGCSVFTGVLPMVILYWLRDGLADLVSGIYQTVQLGHIESFRFRSPLIFLKWPIEIKDTALGLSFSYFAIILFATLFMILLRKFLIPHAEEKISNLSLASILILSIFSFTHIWHWTHEFRMPQSGALIHILWAYLIYLIFRRSRRIHKKKNFAAPLKVVALSAVFVLALSIQIFLVLYSCRGHAMVQYDGGSISLRFDQHQEIGGTERAKIQPPARQAVTYTKILNYISKNTAPDDRILCFGESPIYFLSDRKNATEFDNGRIPAYFPKRRRVFLNQIMKNKPKIIFLRQWEYRFWLPKMPEIFAYITSHYFYAKKIHNFYVFSSIDIVNKPIRRANLSYWEGDIGSAVGSYLKGLEKKNKNPQVWKILNRLFTSDSTSRRALTALDGYYLKKGRHFCRLRWGSKRGRHFSGRISFLNQRDLDKVLLRVDPYPDNTDSLNVSHGKDSIEFSSDISNNVSGMDIVFTGSHPPLSMVFDLRKDGKNIQRIFIPSKGYKPLRSSLKIALKSK